MTELTAQPIIGLIGTGVMGKSMAGHLIHAGYEVHVYTRTKAKAQELLENGAQWQETPGALAQKCQVIMTMVGFPSDVEDIYFGQNGIIAMAEPGSFLIDFTTSSPSLAKRIYEEALTRQLFSLDAPVSGGDIGAREARLSIMVGGARDVFEQMLPIFQKIGTNIVHQGEAGAGQHTKMCNQIAIASNMMGVVEALVYAKKAGLNPTTVLQSIETGAAGSWSLSNLGPRMIADNFAPGFYVKHFIKDMKIALQSAEEMKVELPGLTLAKSLYEQLAAMGEEESGTQALYKLINK
ncbi:NAD(P)-dependent oxidoreductase [Paenibacillus qinlingensis]|uniref:NAD(P)-dependent oxidoreductase n=1 Tax=Paenibacillus qinlingensis TaxID=1837343 RepID=UPI001564D5FB|nr:NAD(P)-dependent oxidoreductase [Paenibacillus qinlingensis]NQX58785.1 NAD(P)-dependent oxidoreductase [Paenibacillus qinlingensis]